MTELIKTIIKTKFKKGKDYKKAINKVKILFKELKKEFGSDIKGISITGSIPGKYYMEPINTEGLSEEVINKIRGAKLPILGESKGSDVDTMLFAEKDRMKDIAFYLSNNINDLAEEIRLVHFTIIPYEESLKKYKEAKRLLGEMVKTKKVNEDYQKIGIDGYYVICDEALKSLRKINAPWVTEDKEVQKRVYNYHTYWRFFLEPFRSINHEIPKELERVLRVSNKIKTLLFRFELEEKLRLGFLDKYYEKRKRYEELEKLKKVHKELRKVK